MNINGIYGPGVGARPLAPDPRTRAAQQEQRPAPAAAPVGTQTVAAPARAATPAVPAEAPAGTDPELWAVLSTEERAFFAKVGAMGPLTYGHLITTGRAEVPIARGGRLDVRG